MKNFRSSFILLILLLSISAGHAFAQKFEGTLIYNIYYIPSCKQIKTNDLEIQFGNKEMVSIKNGNYRSDRLYNDEVLKTTIYNNAKQISLIQPNQCDYWIKNQLSHDIEKKLIKLDTLAVIGLYPCDVYRYSKTSLKVTFFVSKEKYAGKNPDNSWFTYPTSFQGPVVKLVVWSPDYTMVQQLASVDVKTLDNKMLETNNEMVVVPLDDISNAPLESAKRKELLQCFYQSIGYPGFMQLSNTEGKIVVELLVDKTGILKNTGIRTEYFKKQDEVMRIYHTPKLNRLEHKITKKVLPLAKHCLAGYTFQAPVSDGISVNTLLRIPFVFSKNAADVAEENFDIDEQDIDDAFYDDFDEFY
jgi:hypothetical protein